MANTILGDVTRNATDALTGARWGATAVRDAPEGVDAWRSAVEEFEGRAGQEVAGRIAKEQCTILR